MSDRREENEEEITKELQQQSVELQQQLASVEEESSLQEEKTKLLKAKIEQLKHIKTIVRTHGAVPAASLPLDTLHLVRELAPAIFENNIDWSGATKVQESFINNIELPIYINFIDEDGEVLQFETSKGVLTSHVFDRYALEQNTPFLLSRVLYEFRYNGKVVLPLNVNIGSFVVASDDVLSNVIIYVTTKVPSGTEFNNGIAPQISAIVKNHPRYFIDQKVVFRTNVGSITGTITDYDGDTSSFIIESNDDKTKQYDIDRFINLLQDYYTSLSGFTFDIRRYLIGLVSNYESQVEQLDTNQGLEKPNAIILRTIKIRQQIYRVLNFIHEVKDQDEWEEWEIHMFNYFSGKIGEDLTSLADKKKSHLSNTSIHKVNKPILEPEEVVRVKRWPNNDETLEPTWKLGTIRSYTEHEDIDGYGPRRVYSVEFDNGECFSDVEDYQLMPEESCIEEYDLERIGGINRAVGKDSSDQWAREIGWFTAEIEGVDEAFVYLEDAIKAINCRTAIEIEQDTNRGFEKQMELGMLQVIDRISDPIMQQIGRLLICNQWETENSGVLWKMAHGHYNDGNAEQMRDRVLRFAISRQCYDLDPSNKPVNVDLKQLYNFFISSEGCLDTFLLKAPIFREGYDSTMPSESEHEKDSLLGHQSDPEVMMTYLTNNEPDDADEYMSIKFVDGKETERWQGNRKVVKRDAPFKELLTEYIQISLCASIKSLRIKHNERTLFVSSIGKKTPLDLGIADFDTLEITFIQSTPTEEPPKQPSPKGKKKNNNNKKKHKKSKKKRPVQIAPPEDEMEKAKKEWMFSLYRVFAEAEPTFKEIRQRLNAMNLERTKPKQRISSSPSKTTEPVEVVDNPLGDDQLGGKAGKTQFIIQVGEVSNLYKTTKPSSTGRGRRQDDIMIDLHGLTAEEAVYRLDKHLPDWIETAMKGIYPFVIPVKIVCGGGSQILAEVVENWIKQNDNVANAPKNMYF